MDCPNSSATHIRTWPRGAMMTRCHVQWMCSTIEIRRSTVRGKKLERLSNAELRRICIVWWAASALVSRKTCVRWVGCDASFETSSALCFHGIKTPPLVEDYVFILDRWSNSSTTTRKSRVTESMSAFFALQNRSWAERSPRLYKSGRPRLVSRPRLY